MYAPELTVPLLADFQGITLNQHRLREQTVSTIAIAKRIISWNMNIQERALKAIGLTCGRLSSSETFDQRTFTHNAATASMYGRMTLETRLILANFHNSLRTRELRMKGNQSNKITTVCSSDCCEIVASYRT